MVLTLFIKLWYYHSIGIWKEQVLRKNPKNNQVKRRI